MATTDATRWERQAEAEVNGVTAHHEAKRLALNVIRGAEMDGIDAPEVSTMDRRAVVLDWKSRGGCELSVLCFPGGKIQVALWTPHAEPWVVTFNCGKGSVYHGMAVDQVRVGLIHLFGQKHYAC